MSELGAGSGSSYPGSIDTNAVLEVNSPNPGKTKARAEVPNDHAAAIVAIETELGSDPAGTLTDVKTFLQTEHGTDGTHGTISGNVVFKSGTSFTATLDHAMSANRIITIQDATDTLVGRDTTDTLTNKTLSGSSIVLAGSAFPSFSVTKSGNQTIGTSAEIVTWETEAFDTNNNFSSNRFTPTVAGKYLLTASARWSAIEVNNYSLFVYKNGVALYKTVTGQPSTNAALESSQLTVIVDANGSSDYFEIFASLSNSTNIILAEIGTYFQGSRIA